MGELGKYVVQLILFFLNILNALLNLVLDWLGPQNILDACAAPLFLILVPVLLWSFWSYAQANKVQAKDPVAFMLIVINHFWNVAGSFFLFLVLIVEIGLLSMRLLGVNTLPIRVELARLITVDHPAAVFSDPDFVVGNQPASGNSWRRAIWLEDTDCDNEDERIVLWGSASGALWAAVYDSDKGDPPILFPYKLALIDREYLGEGRIWPERADVVPGDCEELLIYGNNLYGSYSTKLSIFTYTGPDRQLYPVEKEPPEDEPLYNPYKTIGSFWGDRVTGPDMESTTFCKPVTVEDRSTLERSQIAIRRTYELVGCGVSYMVGDKLAAPVMETVDFQGGKVPSDVKETPYPEKVVLAFYKNLVEGGVTPSLEDLTTGAARGKFQDLCRIEEGVCRAGDDMDLSYFLPAPDGGMQITGKQFNDWRGQFYVNRVEYTPVIEGHIAVDTIQGPEPMRSGVVISLRAREKSGNTLFATKDIVWMLTRQEVQGEWKMKCRVNDVSELSGDNPDCID